jgi:hypothetical protein
MWRGCLQLGGLTQAVVLEGVFVRCQNVWPSSFSM